MIDAVKKPTFTLHRYDSDGDVEEAGVWLCFDGTMIKVASDPEDWNDFTQHLVDMTDEIDDGW